MAHRDTSGELRRDVCAGADSTVLVPVLVLMTSGAASVEVDEGRAGDARRERADGRGDDEGFSSEEGGGHGGKRMQRVALSVVSAVQWWWGEFKSVGKPRRPLLAGSPRASPSLIGRCILSYLRSRLQSVSDAMSCFQRSPSCCPSITAVHSQVQGQSMFVSTRDFIKVLAETDTCFRWH